MYERFKVKLPYKVLTYKRGLEIKISEEHITSSDINKVVTLDLRRTRD